MVEITATEQNKETEWKEMRTKRPQTNRTVTKDARIYNEEKTISSRSGVGETGKLHVEEQN